MSSKKLENYLSRQFEKRLATSRVEIEQKYRIKKPNAIRSKLIRGGAVKIKSGYEYNEIFDINGKLKKRKQMLRLRRLGNKKSWLTLKGPRQKGNHKKRMEVESSVQYESMRHILELLGFRISETYAKQREEYRFGPCVVCIDHIESHGWFVEIEGSAKDISRTAKKLGLSGKNREKLSYRKLVKLAAAQLIQN